MSARTAHHELTEAVLDSLDDTPDHRLREVLTVLVMRLHELVREIRPTSEEFAAVIDFLTRTGAACSDTRQEFILLADVLGVSSLVESINGSEHGTESTVLGPFHCTASPARRHGDSIDLVNRGEPAVVTCLVSDTSGRPVPDATVDVWQCTADGFYDVQQPDAQPPGNGRGRFRAGTDGRLWFRTVVPSHYPIPTDGPVGAFLKATCRHPFRPAHIHFLVEAPAYRPLTTHAFVAGSPYLSSDAVFAVKDSLTVTFHERDDAAEAAQLGIENPFRSAHVDLVLERST